MFKKWPQNAPKNVSKMFQTCRQTCPKKVQKMSKKCSKKKSKSSNSSTVTYRKKMLPKKMLLGVVSTLFWRLFNRFWRLMDAFSLVNPHILTHYLAGLAGVCGETVLRESCESLVRVSRESVKTLVRVSEEQRLPWLLRSSDCGRATLSQKAKVRSARVSREM